MPAAIALATCKVLPEPDPDTAPLAAALSARGFEVTAAPWDGDDDWSRFDMVILRSTWNYFLDLPAFLAWVDAVAAQTCLLNPAPVVRWNTHKRYLSELAANGVATIPTVLVGAGERTSLSSVCRHRGWTRVVAKPAVSAASYLTYSMEAASAADDEAFAALAGERDMMIQPFVESVSNYGERSLVVIEGQVTHAIRKSPRLGGEDEAVSGPMPITADERALAMAALACVPHPQPLLYARVDMAPGDDAKPMVMELELCEPSLFFAAGPNALAQMADSIAARSLHL